MAAPESVNIHNLSGVYVMNKSLSDPIEPPLSLQGIGWLTRKAILLATVTLTVKHYKLEDGVEQIDIDQVATGNIPGTSEYRTLNNSRREHEDHIFGKVAGTSQYIKLADISDDFLKTGWLPESLEGEFIESNVTNEKDGWAAQQIWGFEKVNGERRYVRHTVVKKGAERVNTRLVYDYLRPNPKA